MSVLIKILNSFTVYSNNKIINNSNTWQKVQHHRADGPVGICAYSNNGAVCLCLVALDQ